MTYLDLLEKRYAVKKFDGKKMTPEQLQALKDAIRLAPSSFNVQSWKVKVVSDQATKEQLKVASWGQEQITSCSHLFVFCAPKDVMKRFEELFALMLRHGSDPKRLEGYKDMVKGSVGARSKEQQFAWAQRQLYLPLMSLMACAQDVGLDSCPMEGFDPEQYAKILKITDAVPTAICAVGHASDAPTPKVRHEEKDVFF